MTARIPRALVLIVGLGLASYAQAQTPNCEDDAAVGPNRVYILAADTQVPLLRKLGKLLRAQKAPLTIVYTPNGSCSNLTYVNQDTFTPNAKAGGTFYIPADPNYDPKTTPPSCTPAATQKPDLAISIVFPDATNCPSAPPTPATVTVTEGPVQAMLFAVPGGVSTAAGSTQRTITAEEAYLVTGLGPLAAMAPPWSDPAFVYGRPASKGTQISIGASIGVPASKWKLLMDAMHTVDQSSMVATLIASHLSDGHAEQAIGILGAEIYDQAANRANLHSLAFRAFGQYRSYWPDSSPTSFDKRNVRDGHYPIWSYVHYLVPQAGGAARNANAQKLVDMLVGKPIALDPAFEPLDEVIGAGLVPACAMKVTRTAEGGPLSLATPTEPCECYYEAKVPMGATACTACTDDSTCGAKKCRHGYCEAN